MATEVSYLPFQGFPGMLDKTLHLQPLLSPPLTRSSLPTVVLWLCKPTALGFCKKICKSIPVPSPCITPRLPQDAGEDGGDEIKNNQLRREARVAEGTLPELAPLGRRMPPGTGFQGHVTLQPGGCQQPSPALAAPLS